MYSTPFGPDDKVVELGGGDVPRFRPNVDVRHGKNVDIVAVLGERLPIENASFSGVYSAYCLEHTSWRKVPSAISEAFRILMPGGTAVFITSNTEAQMRWALSRETFDEKIAQCLFGDLDYEENSHKAAFNPDYAIRLFREAGFESVTVMPAGELGTDMIIEARKSMETKVELPPGPIILSKDKSFAVLSDPSLWTPDERKAAYDRRYFDGGRGPVGGYAREGYWDYPVHWLTFQKVMELKPESVLEIGCSRGYILKRLQDAGVRAEGLEVSRHCILTRVCEGVREWDITQTPWPFRDQEFDLSISVAVLEHVPEGKIDAVASEIRRVSKRGLHGVDFGEHDDGFDKTHCLFRPSLWWCKTLNRNGSCEPYKVVEKDELERGPVPLPPADNKLKVNCGCVAPGTLIHTIRGYKPICELKAGDLILTHKGRYRRVRGVSVRKHKGPIHRISVIGMGSILITSEHPVYGIPKLIIRRGTIRKVGTQTLDWVPAKDVQREFFTFYPLETERLTSLSDSTGVFDATTAATRFPNGRRGHRIPEKLSPDLLRLLGYYVSEGDAGKNTVSFCFNKKEKTYIGDVRRIGVELFNTRPYERVRKRDGYELIFSNVRMAALLREMGGKYSHNKRLSNVVMTFSSDIQKEFLIGAIRGDGSSTNGRLSYGTVSPELARQMKFLLYRQGMTARISEYDGRGKPRKWAGRTITSRHVVYHVRPQFNERSVELCKEAFGNRARELKNQPPTRLLKDGFYGYVESVEALDYDGEVWNLEVEEDNTYVTEVGVVHNSFTTMFHHGWVNIDQHPLQGFAQHHGFNYVQHDLTKGIPCKDDSVDLIYHCHFLEHLTYDQGLSFLKECQRVMKKGALMRILLPDAGKLCAMMASNTLGEFDEINDGCAASPHAAGKLWALLFSGHSAIYDQGSIQRVLGSIGFSTWDERFRESRSPQILAETIDLFPTLSLFVEAVK